MLTWYDMDNVQVCNLIWGVWASDLALDIVFFGKKLYPISSLSIKVCAMSTGYILLRVTWWWTCQEAVAILPVASWNQSHKFHKHKPKWVLCNFMLVKDIFQYWTRKCSLRYQSYLLSKMNHPTLLTIHTRIWFCFWWHCLPFTSITTIATFKNIK